MPHHRVLRAGAGASVYRQGVTDDGEVAAQPGHSGQRHGASHVTLGQIRKWAALRNGFAGKHKMTPVFNVSTLASLNAINPFSEMAKRFDLVAGVNKQQRLINEMKPTTSVMKSAHAAQRENADRQIAPQQQQEALAQASVDTQRAMVEELRKTYRIVVATLAATIVVGILTLWLAAR
jgi:hypothetical protein